MEQLKEFVLKHFKVITVVLTFVLTMYIQHLNNTHQIEELINKCEVLDTKIKDQYERIDAIKLDKALHNEIVKIIEQHRKEHGAPPPSMQAVYDYLHEQHVEKMAEARHYQEVYKNS